MFPVNHPWKTVFFSFLVVAFIASFMRFVAPSVSYKDMLGADHQKLIDYETIQNEYTNDDNLLVLIQDVSGNPFNAKTLSAIEELTQVLWQTPYSIRVDSITNFQHSEAEGDELRVADLVEQAADKDANAVREVREIALAEPLLLNRAVNLAGNVLAINVSFAFPNQSAQEKLDAVGFVYQQLDNLLGQRPDLIGHVSGLVALDATVMQVSQKETGLFLGLVLLSVILLMSLLLRSWKPIAVSVVIFIFSIISGVAFSGMMGWKLTPFTASVPMVILIIAVADCTHLITSFLFAMRSGADKFSAVASALQKNFKPIAITSITTALGFLTLNLSASQGINALGNQVAFGVMVAFFLSVTLLPAALVLLPFKSGGKPSSLSLEKYSGRFVDSLYRFRFGVLLTTVIVVGTLGWTATLNEFNDNIPTYFSKSLPWRQANDFAEEQFGGAYTFSYSIQVNDSVAVSDPDFLAGVEMFVEWLRQQPEVVYVNSVTDTMKKLNRNMHSEDTAFYRLPENRELAAQYLLLYEMSLPFGLDLNNQVNLDKTATRVLVTFKTLSTKEVLAMEKRISNWLEQNLQQGAFLGSGVQLMFAYLLDHDTRALIFGTVGGLFGYFSDANRGIALLEGGAD